MKKLNIALVRVLQFVVFVLFTFIVLVYFGTLVLIPLDLVAKIIGILTMVGLPGVMATLLAIPVVGYLGYLISKIPGLLSTLLDIGFELAIIGQSRVQDFNEIVASLNNSESESAVS